MQILKGAIWRQAVVVTCFVVNKGKPSKFLMRQNRSLPQKVVQTTDNIHTKGSFWCHNQQKNWAKSEGLLKSILLKKHLAKVWFLCSAQSVLERAVANTVVIVRPLLIVPPVTTGPAKLWKKQNFGIHCKSYVLFLFLFAGIWRSEVPPGVS